MPRTSVLLAAAGLGAAELTLPEFTQNLFIESAKRAAELSSEFYKSDMDLVWENNPRQWHQQTARIMDHRFTTLDRLEKAAYDAKKAGVSVLNLIEIQKTKSCPGGWYNGLQLCDHINGSYPVADGSLERWQQMLQNIKPMRLMWWTNLAYWSVQGEVWQQAEADRSAGVGKWFSWDATNADACWGSNPDGAQGSWGSDGANSGIQSGLASFCSETYADYLVDAMANSWTGNLGIDGYTLDISARYNPSGGCGKHGMLQCPDGDGYAGWGKIFSRVRETQPHTVQSGEGYDSWNDMLKVDADIGGQGFGGYHEAMRAAVLEGDVSEVESVASTSGADAASVVCYLHPGYDGKQPGGCPTMYFRDMTPVIRDLKLHQMFVALEAASGVVPQHDYDPDSFCFDGEGQFSGCFEDSNPGAWWNVTADPFDDEESPLWAFNKYRALNRVALRTNLKVSISRDTAVSAVVSSSPLDDYITYEHQNAYAGQGADEIDRRPTTGLTVEQCAQRCSDDASCDCVVYAEDQKGSCWKRGNCDPIHFENDAYSIDYSTLVKKNRPPPPPAGAVAYLKHDSMGPAGDAAILVFNPGEAANITIDLSMLPSSVLGVVPQDLLGSPQSDTPPLSASWTVQMASKEMKFFSGFSLGVFAPRQGKKSNCRPDDSYSKQAQSSTLQGCFLECLADSQCGNVFVEYADITWMEAPPAVSCTLLGAVEDPSGSCEEGTGTLVKKLPGARSCAHLWEGEASPAALGAAPVQPGPSSPACPTVLAV